jgi:hypothetical protein
MKLGPRLRAGISAFCVYRYDSFAESVYYGDELLSYSINYSGAQFGALALAGVQYDLLRPGRSA